MKTSSLLKIVILLTALVSIVAGCGSGGSGDSVAAGSTGSNPQSGGTGSIAANIVWSGSGSAKSTGKTLYAAPPGVATVKIFVYDSEMASLITPRDFPAADGIGIIDGIPVGSGRIVKVWGLDSGGTIRYQVSVSGISIALGQTTNVGTITMTAPVSSASPTGGSYPSPTTVTLSTNETAATIYYTTSGVDPTTSSTKSASPFALDLTTNTILKFFAVDSGFAVESTIHTETYTFP